MGLWCLLRRRVRGLVVTVRGGVMSPLRVTVLLHTRVSCEFRPRLSIEVVSLTRDEPSNQQVFIGCRKGLGQNSGSTRFQSVVMLAGRHDASPRCMTRAHFAPPVPHAHTCTARAAHERHMLFVMSCTGIDVTTAPSGGLFESGHHRKHHFGVQALNTRGTPHGTTRHNTKTCTGHTTQTS